MSATTGRRTVAAGSTGLAARIADDVRAGRRTAVDVAREHLDRAGRLDGIRFAVLDRERTLAEAAALDARPDRFALAMAGVPVVVEDGVDVIGRPNRHGGLRADAAPAGRDDPLVRSLRSAGAVVLAVADVAERGVVTAVRDGAAAIGIGVDRDGGLLDTAAGAGLVALGGRLLPLPGGVRDGGLAATAAIGTGVADVAATTDALAPGPADPGPSGDLVPTPRSATADASVLAAVARRLGDGGVRAHPGGPRLPSSTIRAVRRRVATGTARQVRDLGTDVATLPRELRAQVRRGNRALRLGGPREATAAAVRERVLRWMDDRGADVLVLPVPTPHPGVWNLAGLPSLVAPIDGFRLRLVGRPGAETALLRAATAPHA